MGILSWRLQVSPKFLAPCSGKTVHQTRKCFGGARTCSRFSITVPSLVGLGFSLPLGRQKCWVMPGLECRTKICTIKCLGWKTWDQKMQDQMQDHFPVHIFQLTFWSFIFRPYSCCPLITLDPPFSSPAFSVDPANDLYQWTSEL